MSDQIDAALRKALVRREEDTLELESRLEEMDREVQWLNREHRQYGDALRLIVAADPTDLALDPNWPQRIARAALGISVD